MNIELSNISARIRRHLSLEMLLPIYGWSIVAVLIVLLFLDALIFYAYGWTPSVALPGEAGRPIPAIVERDLAASREILAERRQAFEARLTAPVTLPNPFR